MNRKIAFILIISLTIIIFTLGFVSIMIAKEPIDKNFNGIVRDYKRIYPGLVVFHLNDQKDQFIMANSLNEFKKSLSVGDSISKPKGELNIYIFKKQEGKFVLHKKFVYD
ncbi:MAG: hypothetical protein COA67_09455 [Lutibacter sp.]|nr:MAG: hypothetical protein COA67_09455 [Lutibacter sp.]